MLCDSVTRGQLADAIGASLVTMGIGFAAGPFVTGRENFKTTLICNMINRTFLDFLTSKIAEILNVKEITENFDF